MAQKLVDLELELHCCSLLTEIPVEDSLLAENRVLGLLVEQHWDAKEV